MKKYPFIRFSSANVVYGILGGFLLTGCQIHKPVPVKHLNNVHASAPIYDARNEVRKPKVQSLANVSPTNTQWAPIDIQPLNRVGEEPTQPLKDYQFKPHPSKVSSPTYTKPVASTSRYSSDADFHIVRRGESLYSIARQYGVNVKTIARYNNLFPPYEIYPQQKLALRTDASTPNSYQKPVYIPPNNGSSAPPQSVESNIQWAWPVSGELLEGFKAGVSNGIEISGEPGRTIRSSADGTVLYSGNEVTGYGELVIIEHEKGYMTTYAHNRKLFVQQGDQVKRGQKIAEMGSSEADRTKLHFEIRKGEKPVNPLAYLPKR